VGPVEPVEPSAPLEPVASREPVKPMTPHALVPEAHPISKIEVSTLAIMADVKATGQDITAPIAAPEMAKAV